MSVRLFNFSAGPAICPLPVLEASAKALIDYRGSGVGIAEVSHRGVEFDGVLDELLLRVRKLMNVPATHEIAFFQGGATQLFTTIPMNFLKATADYIVTGEWAKKAAEAAKPYGHAKVIASSEDTKFDRIPTGWKASPEASYLHICTNNTIYGTRWSVIPQHPCLFADVSSEYMARPMEVSKFALIYGGAQKNLGPSGVVMAIVRKDLYERIGPQVPAIFNFKKMAEAKSCINTPPTFGIYILLETMRWIEAEGGIAAIERRNEAKAALIYGQIDKRPGFYKGTVSDKPNRSRMNITFTLPSEELTKAFLVLGEPKRLYGLKGYRTVGGIRASCYNAMPLEGCQALADHMDAFARHGVVAGCADAADGAIALEPVQPLGFAQDEEALIPSEVCSCAS